MRFELTLPEGNRLAVYRVNHSATAPFREKFLGFTEGCSGGGLIFSKNTISHLFSAPGFQSTDPCLERRERKKTVKERKERDREKEKRKKKPLSNELRDYQKKEKK